MNILMLSWRGPGHPKAGGAEQVAHEHAKAWIVAGHTVTLFTSDVKGQKNEETIDGVHVIRRGEDYVSVKVYAFLWYLFKNKKKFDLVIDHFHGVPFFTPLYVRVPIVAVLHELTQEVWFYSGMRFPFGYLLGALGYMTEKIQFVLYRNIPFIVGATSTKRDLEKVGIPKNKIKIIHHGVVLPHKIKKYSKEKKSTIIFLGSLDVDKGIESAIKSFHFMSLERKDVQFWVVGKGSENQLERLENMSDTFALTRKVKFWGYVSEAKKFELLSRAHVLIHPSIREGWGLVVIEANSVGTPAVVYNVTGLVDSTKNGLSGLVLKQNTPEELAKVVVYLLDNKSLYKKLSAGALTWSRRFTWEKAGKESLRFIEGIGIAN